MSFDISLNDPVSSEELMFDSPMQMKGGTYAVGGSRHASLNVTYNYSPHFYRVLGFKNGIRDLTGISGADSIPILTAAANRLNDDINLDYSPHFYRVLGFKNGIRDLTGISGADIIPILTAAANRLNDDINLDYWKPTEGNAKQALLQLLAMAKMRPDGIWEVR